jgi:tetratricopeptide (TPR) repeat protein
VIDYYKLLNVSRNASDDEINTALAKALRTWTLRTNHPQLEVRQDAERKIKSLEEAQVVLLEKTKRSEYDRKLVVSDASGTEESSLDDANLGDKTRLVEEGWKALTDGNVADALFLATKATESDGRNPEAWALLAEAKFRWGDIQDAIYEYKRAIALKPNQASYYFDLGAVFEAHEDWENAVQQYGRAAKIDPKTVMYRAAIGAVRIKQGDDKEGIEILEQCVKEEPENPSYHWFLAVGYADSAHEKWTYVPPDNEARIAPGYYATAKDQVTHAQTLIARAEAMNHEDPELRRHVQSVKADINRMLERHFNGSVIVPLVGGILWAIIFGTVWSGLAVLGAVLAGLYFYVSRPPQYAMNHQILFKGGFATADDSLRGEGFGGGLFAAALSGLALPIMVLVNYVKYQTGENAT